MPVRVTPGRLLSKQDSKQVKLKSVCRDSTLILYREGDNLDILKLLQQGFLRRIKMIYMDPPYNPYLNHTIK